MVDSLERIPIRGECLKCTCTNTVDVVYAKVGFDLWFDCVNCGAISGALESAKSVEDVRRVFDQVIAWRGYP